LASSRRSPAAPPAGGGHDEPARRSPPIGSRRNARELALQLLYELDLRGEAEPGAAAEGFWRRHPGVPEDVRSFAETIVRGTKAQQDKIDEMIRRFAEHWDLDRMAVVDRNILRAGIFELLWAGDIPPKVAINEALEVARKFSTEESTRFINGILDRVLREMVP
jgi:N utilization substance protein B